MKVDREPRIAAGPGMVGSLIDIFRKLASVINGNDDTVQKLAVQVAALEQRVTDLEAGP